MGLLQALKVFAPKVAEPWAAEEKRLLCPHCHGALLLYEEDGCVVWRCYLCGRPEHPPETAPMKPRERGPVRRGNGKGHHKR